MKVTFNQGAMGHISPKPTSLGTNLMELLQLEGIKEERPMDPYTGPSSALALWAPGMCSAISLVMQRWLVRPRMTALTKEQWKRHVDQGHQPYEKTCEVCVTSSGTGRRHVRVEHPESFVLSADLSGPMREGGADVNGHGAHPKPHKYLFVAKLRLPETYLQGYSAGKCDLSHSWEESWASEDLEPDDGLRVEASLEPITLASSDDLQPDATSSEVHPSTALLGDEFSGELCDVDPVSAGNGGNQDLAVGRPLQDPREAVGACDVGERVVMDPQEEERRSVRRESLVDEADLLADQNEGLEGEEETVPKCERSDLLPPKMARMIFSIPLPDAKSATVKEALQDVLLYLRAHNVPVLRFHSDRGSASMARETRQMLKSWGLRVTTSEGGIPQTNGAAEQGVKWLKQRIRSLLIGAKLPLRLWPSAADTACVMQRAALTGMPSKLAAPFGATAHVRKRPYTGAGTTAKPDSLRTQWVQGHYLGLSSTLNERHVIFVPPVDDQPEGLIHTFHVRKLVHPGPLEDKYHEPEPPGRPSHRIRGKQSLDVRLEPLRPQQPKEESLDLLQQDAEDILVNWDYQKALDVLDRASAVLLNGSDFKIGAFRHGGVTGLLRGTEKHPWLSRLMVRCFTELDEDITFTAVCMSIDTERDVHVDRHNQGGSMNYVIPVAVPRSGGGLWVELQHGDQVLGSVTSKADSSGKQRFGITRPLERGQVMRFDARRLHATEPWRGRRMVLIAYTPALTHKLSPQDVTRMVRLGFPIDNDMSDSEGFEEDKPSKQGPRLERTGGWSEILPAGGTSYHFDVSWKIREEPGPSIAMLQFGRVGCVGEFEKHATILSSSGIDRCLELAKNSDSDTVVDPGVDAIMYSGEVFLDLKSEGDSPGLAQLCLGEEEQSVLSGPKVGKTEVLYTKDIERVIKSLTGPLQVVHNVDPSEVLQNIEVWIPAIEKERSLMLWIRFLEGISGNGIYFGQPGCKSCQRSLCSP